MPIDTVYKQYAYGSDLTINLSIDPTAFENRTMRILNFISGATVVSVTDADPALTFDAQAGSVWPVRYELQQGDLDVPGVFFAELWLEDADGSPAVGSPFVTELFKVERMLTTPPWA